MTAALCARHPYDPAMWDFEIAGETARQRKQRHRMAAEVCSRCPLQRRCANSARSGVEEGVWGGQVLAEIPMPHAPNRRAAA